MVCAAALFSAASRFSGAARIQTAARAAKTALSRELPLSWRWILVMVHPCGRFSGAPAHQREGETALFYFEAPQARRAQLSMIRAMALPSFILPIATLRVLPSFLNWIW